MENIFHSFKEDFKLADLLNPLTDIETLYSYIEQLENAISERLNHEYEANISSLKKEETGLIDETGLLSYSDELPAVAHSNILIYESTQEPTLEDIFDEDFLLELEEEVYKQIDEYEIYPVFYIDSSLKNTITNTVLEDTLMSLELICDEGTSSYSTNMYNSCALSDEYDLDLLNVEQLRVFIKERVDIYFDHIFAESNTRQRPHILPRSIPIEVFDRDRPIYDEEYMHSLGLKIELLGKQYQPIQRTSEWYDMRNQIMTASNIYKIFGSQSQYNSFICEKCNPVVNKETPYINTNDTRHWGQKYEKLTLLIYETMYNVRVSEFGCIRHPSYDYIGASPDGIVTGDDPLHPHYGRMVEIKNIVNRVITGEPLEAYWVQMQVQMEVCDLDVCNFIETRFKECDTVDEWKSICKKKGVAVSNIPILIQTPSGSSPEYKRNPPDFSVELTNDYIQSPEYEFFIYDENTPLTEFIEKWSSRDTVVSWWYMEEFSCVVVPRNRAWFASVLPKLTDAWNTIIEERGNGEYKKRLPKKKIPKSRCLIQVVLKNSEE